MKANPEDDEDYPYFCDCCGQGLEEEWAFDYVYKDKQFCGTCAITESKGRCGYGAKLAEEIPADTLRRWRS